MEEVSKSGDDASCGSGRLDLADLDNAALGAVATIASFGWRSVSTCKDSISSSPKSSGGYRRTEGTKRVQGLEDEKYRLWCSLCNRRVLTDNFLMMETGSHSHRNDGGEEVRVTKRRRVSGGGTRLKPMDLVAEHRSYCPWAYVHPVVQGGYFRNCVPCLKYA